VDAHAQAGFGETERRGAAGDAAADDCNVDAAVVAAVRTRRDGVFEPVRVQDTER
jgi:hypothetical protein